MRLTCAQPSAASSVIISCHQRINYTLTVAQNHEIPRPLPGEVANHVTNERRTAITAAHPRVLDNPEPICLTSHICFLLLHDAEFSAICTFCMPSKESGSTPQRPGDRTSLHLERPPYGFALPLASGHRKSTSAAWAAAGSARCAQPTSAGDAQRDHAYVPSRRYNATGSSAHTASVMRRRPPRPRSVRPQLRALPGTARQRRASGLWYAVIERRPIASSRNANAPNSSNDAAARTPPVPRETPRPGARSANQPHAPATPDA